jgi:hypothetical protein
MNKYFLPIISIFLLSNLTANCAVNDNYLNNVDKIEKYLIAENSDFSFQNYLIFSKKPIKNITSSNTTVANAYVVTTIENSRDTVIVEVNFFGTATLSANVDNKNVSIMITVSDNGTKVESKSDLFDIIPLDIPNSVTSSEGV